MQELSVVPAATDVSPVSLTPAAARTIAQVLSEKGAKAFRMELAVGGDGRPAYRITAVNEPLPSDRVFVEAGVTICMDPATAQEAHGTAIDFEDAEDGGRLLIQKARGQGGCGCAGGHGECGCGGH